MTKTNKVKRQVELRIKLKKIETDLKILQKKLQEIKKRAEKILDKNESEHTSSKIKGLRESL